MDTKAKLFGREEEGVGVNKINFWSFKVGLFILTHIYLTSPLIILGYNVAKGPKDTKWLFCNGQIEKTWLDAPLDCHYPNKFIIRVIHFTAS